MSDIFVLDLNVLRRPVLLEKIESNQHARFVIPDMALVEMSKENWEVEFRNSFEKLIPYVNRCFMSCSVQEAINKELETYRVISNRLVPKSFTFMLRKIIIGSKLGRKDPYLGELMKEFDIGVRQELLQNDLNADQHRFEVSERVAIVKAALKRNNELKKCHDPKFGRAHKVKLAGEIGEQLYYSYMKRRDIPAIIIEELRQGKSLTLRWCFLLAHHTLNWVIAGGLNSAHDKTVMNDVLDQDYILTASFFSGVWSLETAVNNSAADLKDIICSYG